MEHGIRVRAQQDLKRAANEILYASAREGGAALPYFCECEDVDCLEAVWLEAADYAQLRRSGRLVVAWHEAALASAG